VQAKLYSDKHEWVELVENSTDQVKVGITKYAADALGDVVQLVLLMRALRTSQLLLTPVLRSQPGCSSSS
jgi:hypothetical protein